jgi:hypothetical protein
VFLLTLATCLDYLPIKNPLASASGYCEVRNTRTSLCANTGSSASDSSGCCLVQGLHAKKLFQKCHARHGTGSVHLCPELLVPSCDSQRGTCLSDVECDVITGLATCLFVVCLRYLTRLYQVSRLCSLGRYN